VINLKVLQRMLVRLGVQQIEAFNDGNKALAYLRGIDDAKSLPNLILSDLHMPNLDGFALIAQLREMTRYETPPVVMACSGKSQLTCNMIAAFCCGPLTRA
jgi:CheY-like chemotaxis protein